MNNSHQAKNGFKTFLVTLIISLGVFAAVYYLTSYPSYEMDIEETTGGKTTEKEVSSDKGKQLGMANQKEVGEASPFAELNSKEYDVRPREVLAGADEISDEGLPEGFTAPETTQSTVPDTGTLGMTISLFVSLAILSGGFYYVYLNPRKLALQSFEDQFRI